MNPGPPHPTKDIRVKRIYRAARVSDGRRILVDRIWPRGMAKHRARLHSWERDIAPSDDLRTWFHAHPDRWDDFAARYGAELDQHRDKLREIADHAREGIVTLLYASKDEDHNNAVVLRRYLCQLLDQDEKGDR
ncbi:DUF488 domain-containing protein [Pukyongiella litopenaei]|uniref:DUF488 family protein n=1 Tax=Pukyongiella litopenaei TaxID=2605946 RepID=A0A2S0MUF5_9RHOB|nr:DUF488 family protein [Pukyongiella litopenaei]AVO39505.1 DUF488 family protein [Pukyongiella litopenaei]